VPAVVLSIQKSPGTNTLALTRRSTPQLDADRDERCPPASSQPDVFRQSHFIERSVHNVVAVLVEATIIVGVILILFLLNVRTRSSR
jgi:HME family heavy-metal exporter